MEVSFAITGKGYVIIAADQNASRSIIKMKGDEDKVKILGSHLAMAYSGEPGRLRDFQYSCFLSNLFSDYRGHGPVCRIRRTQFAATADEEQPPPSSSGS